MSQSTKTASLNDVELNIHQVLQLLISQDDRIVELEKKMALLLEQQMCAQEKCTNDKNKEQILEEIEYIEEIEEIDEALFNKKRMSSRIIFDDNVCELDEDETVCMLEIDRLNEQENIGSISDGEDDGENGENGENGETKIKIDTFDNTRMKFSNELCGNN